MKATADKRPRGRRVMLLVSDAMLLAALLIVTSPWTSGVYTWLAQRSLSRETPARTAAGGTRQEREASAGERPAGRAARPSREASAWAAAAEGTALGRLAIPRLGLDVAFVKGAHEADLRRGPGWVPWTSPPGAANCAISGHRTTYLAPFRRIDTLVPGDEVRIETAFALYTYRVTRRFFVERDDADILFPTREPTLTLTSCHPPYSDRFRIVVQATLTKTERR